MIIFSIRFFYGLYTLIFKREKFYVYNSPLNQAASLIARIKPKANNNSKNNLAHDFKSRQIFFLNKEANLIFKNIKLAFFGAYKMSLLPNKLQKFNDNIFIIILGTICILLYLIVVTGLYSILIKNKELQYIIIFLSFIYGIFIIFINTITLIYGLNKMIQKTESLVEIENLPVNSLSSFAAVGLPQALVKLVLSVKLVYSFIYLGFGILASAISYDTFLVESGKEKFCLSIIARLIFKLFSGDMVNKDNINDTGLSNPVERESAVSSTVQTQSEFENTFLPNGSSLDLNVIFDKIMFENWFNWFLDLFRQVPVEGYFDDLLDQQLLFLILIFVAALATLIFFCLFLFINIIHNNRDYLLKRSENRLIKLYIRYQLFLTRISRFIIPLFIIVGLLEVLFGTYYLITHFLPYEELGVDLHKYVISKGK